MKTHWSWLVLVAGLAACSDKPENVWIVVDLIDPAGRPPPLMEGINSRFESRGSRYLSARWSRQQPIKLKA